MRDMKFRAWDKKANHWVSTNILICFDGSICWSIGYDIKEIQDEEQYAIVWFTGLKDKNGSEIYEGDIVECTFYDYMRGDGAERRYGKFTEKGMIKWNEFKCGFMLHTGAEQYIDLFIGSFRFEVIGNIYENKELLKEAKK